MVNTSILSLILVVLHSLLRPSAAEIKNPNITNDARPMILFEKFGFTPGGYVTINISEATFSSTLTSPNPSHVGFFLLSEENVIRVLSEYQLQNPKSTSNVNDKRFCILSSPHVRILLTFRDLSPPPFNSFSNSFPVTNPDDYSLFFANCVPQGQVTMSVLTEMYNLQADGQKDYLSVGQSLVPSLYASFAAVYVVFLGLWIYLCLFRNRSNSHWIHLLMGVLLPTKALKLFFAFKDQHDTKVNGIPHGWDVPFRLLQLLRLVFLFTVIVLIGIGWSFLQKREMKVLMIVIPLQVIVNITTVVKGETGPFIQDWVTWIQLLIFIDIICCGAIIVPIVRSIRTLRETSKTNGKAARKLAKLTLFRNFYLSVVGNLYFSRIMVFTLKNFAVYKYRWVSIFAEEAASLAIYLFLFYMFRPVKKSEHVTINDDEEEETQVALREEEFVL